MGQLKQTQVCYPVPARLLGEIQNHNSNSATSLAQLNAAPPTLLHMRDGEVVLYRRTNSPTWQTRYKLKDGSWCRASTRKMPQTITSVKFGKTQLKKVIQIGALGQPRVFITMNIKSRLHCVTCSSDIN